MRVSTGMIYDAGVSAIQRQTASLVHTQQQIATGRRMLTPADDPVAAARALEVTQAREVNAQYRITQDNARSVLGLVEGQLAAVGDLLQDVRERAVQGANAPLSDSDRGAIARDLRARFDQLVGIANATDGSGLYLFSGYQGATRPFSGDLASGIVYRGDDGQRALQIAPSRGLPVSDSGSDVFMRIRSGNGDFATGFAAANSGTGVIDAGTVIDPAVVKRHNYTITFAVSGGATTYDVVDQDASPTPTSLKTGSYIPGGAIDFDGLTVSISGAPGGGDRFTITPSVSQSMFATLTDLIGALEAPVANGAGRARLSNQIGRALTDLDQALDNVLQVRASVGSRLSEIDAFAEVSEDLSLQYEQTLSRLQDVDYAQAISQLTREQSTLEAAQRSFVRVSGLSLFDYL